MQIIKAEIGGFKPLINEVVKDCYVKERQIIEYLCFFFALDQLLKSVICKIFITGQIDGIIAQNSSSCQFLSGVCGRGILTFWTFWGLKMRDKSSDRTLSSGGAVASGFAREIFGAEAGFEALGCFNFFGFGAAGASSDSASSAGSFTGVP